MVKVTVTVTVYFMDMSFRNKSVALRVVALVLSDLQATVILRDDNLLSDKTTYWTNIS